ncbi:class I fructose-bisphosphate aldolase [Candidatus Anaplasma sp. TIGMIC]|uniref:class I fructose-bisphosphate aldolase n=1 Tax=Candidatus Anaplasma sp. TIGMIC TaxID=3020713 RepID=UPI00232D17A0|nr:class I fructose-bisphosphate aldolase [Candidatus Anaplasma sp. TIGMIC]MDB1135452.1 class I fructose-bisphosphate aldolase [Candidatus Anaplasma sp. TIGMIC]
MGLSEQVRRVLDCYDSENPGVKGNLVRMLTHGKMGGSGRLLILPVDQGLEHGPVRSFDVNPSAFDPHYHFKLAIRCGFSAYAAPLGMLECGAAEYAGQIPTILKLNSSTALAPAGVPPTQAITSSVRDALRLGCSAVGLTIYPGSAAFTTMVSEAKELIREAKSHGLAVVVWSYPRGGDLSKKGETALDIIAYSAHIAASLGANIIKVKLPTSYIERNEVKSHPHATLAERVAYVKKCCFAGRRMVVFSGGDTKSDGDLLDEVAAVRDGGGDGSMIGRNSFQRSEEEAVSLVANVIRIYC